MIKLFVFRSCQQLVTEAQMSGVELLGTVLSLCTSPHRHSGGVQPIVEQLKRVLVVQYDLSLQYRPELSSVILSLFAILLDSELEHEQLCMLKFLLFLVNWKSETGKCSNLFDDSTVLLGYLIPSTDVS